MVTMFLLWLNHIEIVLLCLHTCGTIHMELYVLSRVSSASLSGCLYLPLYVTMLALEILTWHYKLAC